MLLGNLIIPTFSTIMIYTSKQTQSNSVLWSLKSFVLNEKKTQFIFIVVGISEKRHKCQACGKSYRYKEGLYNHQKFECGKDPQFQCPHCPHRTKHKGNLKSHIISRHKPIIFPTEQS